MIKDDGQVIHFNNPKVQASLAANIFAITGNAEVKRKLHKLLLHCQYYSLCTWLLSEFRSFKRRLFTTFVVVEPELYNVFICVCRDH